jgi:6-phosphogluconolactonase (cycloisomerase 2 family)
MALFASLTLGLGMTACGGGTIGYMWVLGQQYNNIAGFKIDDYTGNLTQIINSPFNSNGAVPVSIVIKPGGRYVYVINQGTCPSAGCGTGQNISQNIALYSVGGDGTLNFQQTYYTEGYDSQWAQMDSTGSYLYVLDKYAPDGSGQGSITAFTSDPNTGRLALLQNTQSCGLQRCPVYWKVGTSPFQMKAASGCLFTVNAANQSLSYYQISSNGQLTYTATGVYGPTNYPISGAVNITSINSGSTLLMLTDAGNNSVYLYTVGSSCNPSVTAGGTLNQSTFDNGVFASVSNPTWTFVDSTGKYLYVLNYNAPLTTTQTPFSTITAYTINNSGGANNALAPIPGAPYSVGAGPVCMLEDPTNQYMYNSDHYDGTVTGKVLDPNTGELSQLSKGSTFQTTTGNKLGCLAISGSVE